MTNEQTEADFQGFLAAQFIVGSSVTPGAERTPGGKSRKANSGRKSKKANSTSDSSASASASSTTPKQKTERIDLILRTDQRVILVELKTLRAFIRRTEASQSLLLKPSDDVGLTTERSGETYPPAGLKNLHDLSKDDFLLLGCAYGSKNCRTVGDVHASAEDQVRRYAQGESRRHVTSTVLTFAVTQVVNRFHVTQVQW